MGTAALHPSPSVTFSIMHLTKNPARRILLILINRDKKLDLNLELEDVKVGNKNHIVVFSILFLVIL